MRKQGLKLIVGMAKAAAKKGTVKNTGQLIDASKYSGKNKTMIDIFTGEKSVIPITKREYQINKAASYNRAKNMSSKMDTGIDYSKRPTKIYSDIPFNELSKFKKNIKDMDLPKNNIKKSSLKNKESIIISKGKRK